MQFTYAVSFESDTQPVETLRGEVEAIDAEDAIRRGLRRAVDTRTGRGKYRSLVVVVQDLAAAALKMPNVYRAEQRPTQSVAPSE